MSMNRRGCVVHVLACRATFNHGRWCRNNFYDNKIRLAEYLSRRNLIRQEAVSILGNVFWRRSSGRRQTAGGGVIKGTDPRASIASRSAASREG